MQKIMSFPTRQVKLEILLSTRRTKAPPFKASARGQSHFMLRSDGEMPRLCAEGLEASTLAVMARSLRAPQVAVIREWPQAPDSGPAISCAQCLMLQSLTSTPEAKIFIKFKGVMD